MIASLFFVLKTIITHLLEIIVQPEVIESCKSDRQLKKIDTDKTNLLPVNKINNRFSLDFVVNKLKRFDAITSSQIKEIKRGAQLFVIAMLSTLLTTLSPLGSAVLRCASIFDASRISVLSRCQEKSCIRNSKFFGDVSLTLE